MSSISSPHILSTCCSCLCCSSLLKGRYFGSLKEIISDYITNCRPNAENDFLLFKNLKTLKEAVELAGEAKCPNCGKKLSHQRRIPKNILEKAKLKLIENLSEIKHCGDFGEFGKLIRLIEAIISKDIRGIGKLTVYDTALRIGANLQIEPKVIYLHAGTEK